MATNEQILKDICGFNPSNRYEIHEFVLLELMRKAREDELEKMELEISTITNIADKFDKENERLRKGIEQAIKNIQGYCRCHTLKQAKCVFCRANWNLIKLLEDGEKE